MSKTKGGTGSDVVRHLGAASVPLPPKGGTVILSLQGGLGNQLFQWAFGMALRAQGIDVHVDTVRCRRERPLAVAPLLVDWPHVSRPEGLMLWAAHKARVLHRLGRAQLSETGFGYDEAFVDRIRGINRGYLVGYFQSPHYFHIVAPVVRQDASRFLAEALTHRGRELQKSLGSQTDTVAIHVRRGDYLTGRTTAHHGVLNSDYYQRALAHLQRGGSRRLVWFSDDIDWVKAHLASSTDIICDPSMTTDPRGEIALMAACGARVVANSSFSWWGGWLGQPSTEVNPVIAPTRWLAAAPDRTRDVVPGDWVLI